MRGGGLGFLEMGPHLQEICLHSKKNQANMERTWELDVMRRVFLPGEMLFALQSGVLEDLDRTELYSLNMIEELSC